MTVPAGKGLMNRHPVDRLADVRRQIAELEKEGERLRQMIFDGKCTLTGDSHIAAIHEIQRENLDRPAVLSHYGRDALAPFLRRTEYTLVKLLDRPKEPAR